MSSVVSPPDQAALSGGNRTEYRYERPRLTPVGNLNDVLAASTQQLDVDSAALCASPPGQGHISC